MKVLTVHYADHPSFDGGSEDPCGCHALHWIASCAGCGVLAIGVEDGIHQSEKSEILEEMYEICGYGIFHAIFA